MTIEGLGKKFQDARLARGLTLDEAARLTKIRPLRLAEIEVDDFSQFPSLAYAKGFLQIYGKFLDVDVTPYLDAFETSQQMTVDGTGAQTTSHSGASTRAGCAPPAERRPVLAIALIDRSWRDRSRVHFDALDYEHSTDCAAPNGRRSSTDRFASSTETSTGRFRRGGSVASAFPSPRCGGRSSAEESSGCKRTSIDCARAVTSSSDCSSGSSEESCAASCNRSAVDSATGSVCAGFRECERGSEGERAAERTGSPSCRTGPPRRFGKGRRNPERSDNSKTC